jgi:hypothetical protein
MKEKASVFSEDAQWCHQEDRQATASGAKVNSSLNPEDLAYMVDLSVASKYGDDMT